MSLLHLAFACARLSTLYIDTEETRDVVGRWYRRMDVKQRAMAAKRRRNEKRLSRGYRPRHVRASV